MKIAIGGLDYTAVLDAARSLTVTRKLNQPSSCRLWVTLPQTVSGAEVLAVPRRNQALAVTGDNGTVYFTGYIAVSPLPEYAGLGMAGPLYRVEIQAVSDEILLDTQLLPPTAGTTGAAVGQVVQGLVTRTGSASLRTAGLTLSTPVGRFVPEAGAKFSVLAGQAAAQGRAAYRAVSGTLSLSPVGAAVHPLDETAGTLALGNLTFTAALERALANDVTVCGEEEPVAYVTEYFLGDGTTKSFPLAEVPYFGPTAAEKIIWELFQEASVDTRVWGYSAGDGGFFTITGGGLTINGGTGRDGDAAMAWLDGVEAGGTLLFEVTGVNLSLGSTGTLAGLYSGAAQAANCVAGFAVTAATGTGVVSLAPLIQGTVAGGTFALDAAKQYTLRVRVRCPEVERITQIYRVTGDSGLVGYGGNGVVAQAQVLLEIQEFADGVGATPVTLYDGAVGFVPASYLVSPASSVNLIGTIRSVFLKGLGTGWVTSTVSGGGPRSRRIGAQADAAECYLTRTGTLEFYTGNEPALGETVAVNYRSVGRAVGRAVNAASQAALAAAGAPATAVWTGTVTEPKGRSSKDCRNAAQALATAASSVSAAWSGSYTSLNIGLGLAAGGDVWPGDALLLTAPSFPVAGSGGTTTGLDAQVVVREAVLEYASSQPDLVVYKLAFSNDWANDLSVKTSRTVPADAWLPAAISPTYLANLTGLVVTAITAAAVTVQMNVTAPAGGGFEVRRRDFAFQPGQDADLVIRAVVSTFDIPRTTEADRFYIRMYDGSTPPNYSEFSVGLFVNLPLS